MVCLFALAIGLYAPGVWWGVPHATAADRIHPWGSDELAPLGPLAELYNLFIAPEPTFNPQYPLFQYVVQAAFIGPYLVWLKLTGGLASPSPSFPYGLANPAESLVAMTIAARLANCLMAGGVVLAAYRTGKLLWDESTGLAGAAIVLFSYPMFYYSRTSNVDMGALFWTSFGVLAFAHCLRSPLTVRRAVWLGACAALATATKDASYAAFAAIAVCLLPLHIRQARAMGGGISAALRAPLAGIATGAALYVVASGMCFSSDRFRSHLHFITHGSPMGDAYYQHAASISGYLSLLGEVVGHCNDAIGTPALAMAALGVACCAARAPSRLILAVPAVGVLLGVVLPVRFVLLRFVLVMAYVLGLFAAHGLMCLVRSRVSWHRPVGVLATVVVLGWSLVRGGDLTYQMLADSRYELANWLRRNVAAGDLVGYYGASAKLPALGPSNITVWRPIMRVGRSAIRPSSPRVILVIPQQPTEPHHERDLPNDVFAALCDGSLGYEQAAAFQTPSLFSRRPISFVNPPVRVFVRKELPVRLERML